jgi:hypothetical protein
LTQLARSEKLPGNDSYEPPDDLDISKEAYIIIILRKILSLLSQHKNPEPFINRCLNFFVLADEFSIKTAKDILSSLNIDNRGGDVDPDLFMKSNLNNSMKWLIAKTKTTTPAKASYASKRKCPPQDSKLNRGQKSGTVIRWASVSCSTTRVKTSSLVPLRLMKVIKDHLRREGDETQNNQDDNEEITAISSKESLKLVQYLETYWPQQADNREKVISTLQRIRETVSTPRTCQLVQSGVQDYFQRI